MRTYLLGMEKDLVSVKESAAGYVSTVHLKGTAPTRVAYDPQNKKRLYCSTKKAGLFKSEDRGDSWVAVGEDAFSSSMVTAVAVDARGFVYAGTEPSRLYCSKDLGETWVELAGIQTLPSKGKWAFPPRPETHFVRWITPSFQKDGALGVSIEAGAFIRTEDDGRTWLDRPEGSPKDTHTLLAHPMAPGRLYSASGDRAYAESLDAGKTWFDLNEGIGELSYLYHLALNPVDPDDRFVSASQNARDAHSGRYSTVYRKPGNEPWREMADGLPKKGTYTQVLAADPSQTTSFHALTNHGLYQWEEAVSAWNKLDIPWKEAYLTEQPTSLLVLTY